MYSEYSEGSAHQTSIISNEHYDDTTTNEELDFRIASSVERIRKILEREGIFIPSHCDQFIIRCLRVKDYDEAKTAKLLKNFGIMMRLDEMQDLFEQFIPSQFKDFYYSGIVTPLTKRDSQGRLILLGRLGRWKVDEYDFDQALAASIVLFNYCAAKSIKTQHCGVVAVLDFRGWNLQQMLAIKIGRLKIAVKLMQDSCPAKIKGFHILRHPRLVKVLYFLLTPFLKKKLRSRIHFHSDESSLHELIGPDIIPATSEAVAQNSYFDEKMITDLLSEDKYNLDMVTFGYPSC